MYIYYLIMKLDLFVVNVNFQTSSVTGEDLFKSDPFVGVGASSSPKPPSSSTSSLPLVSSTTLATSTTPHAVDPFSGQDPFHSDPFGSADKSLNQARHVVRIFSMYVQTVAAT